MLDTTGDLVWIIGCVNHSEFYPAFTEYWVCSLGWVRLVPGSYLDTVVGIYAVGSLLHRYVVPLVSTE